MPRLQYIKHTKKITVITCEHFEYVKVEELVPIFLQKVLLSHFEPPTKEQERWKGELNTEIVNGDLICKITIYLTKTNQFTGGFFSAKYCIEF